MGIGVTHLIKCYTKIEIDKESKMKAINTLVFPLLITIISIVNGEEQKKHPCQEHPEVRSKCFWLHGRLSYWNGTPAARIWKIGTKRMLGVSDGHALPEYEQMPEYIRKLMVSFDTEIYGDFEFCPFTKEKPGVMQLGCIQSGKNMHAKQRKE
jgi:hypothetical protein